MSVTRFLQPADNVTDRMIGFMAHLRENGIAAGFGETECALKAMTTVDLKNPVETCMALKSICAREADHFARFDDLFKAYWLNQGRQKQRSKPSDEKPVPKNQWSNRSIYDDGVNLGASGAQDLPDDDNEGDAPSDGEGKLVATRNRNIEKADLREFMKPEDMAHAQKVAERIAKAIRDRRSRRRKMARRGAELDLRRITRKSIARGGEPFDLLKRQKPDRPVRLVALLDVSGSMKVYARIFLSFLKGLMSHDQRTDAYLFHTQLVCISDALRDGDSFRGVNRLSMMAQGFGGGTKIASNLALFNQQYAAKRVNGRSVVIILSDGYDTDPPEKMAHELARLKKSGCKIIWLNPLKGWKDYEPVAKGMAASLPFLDHFAAATTLNDLAALEPHLGRL